MTRWIVASAYLAAGAVVAVGSVESPHEFRLPRDLFVGVLFGSLIVLSAWRISLKLPD